MSNQQLSHGDVNIDYKRLADAIRVLSMDAVQNANSGHPGMPMGMADVASVLFGRHLVFDPSQPHWANRDRFILSAGHGSMLLYSLLYLTGYKDITLEDLKQFRQLGAKTAGHPEYGYAAGIETTTGPLGQGLANAVGFALAERILAARYGDDIVDHRTYTIAGDGCLMEGISQEAISFAGHLKLHKLVVLWDDNRISIDGPTSLSTSDNQKLRFEASGWNVLEVDGHDHTAIDEALTEAKKSSTPVLIACHTVIGYGSPTKSGSSSSHGSPLGEDEIAGARAHYGWTAPAFVIPEDILGNWRELGLRSQSTREAWDNYYAKLDGTTRQSFEREYNGELPENFDHIIDEYKQKLVLERPAWATRKASGNVLEVCVTALPELIGGSADLTGSNLTKTSDMQPITADDFSGNYIYYGIREHAMGAIMNGLSLHGGLIPYGGTFMVFTDYCRPAIRLSALMHQRVTYVMTHDSIGLGEDGPTHQPVEHLASLRAMPNLHVFRPADAVETTECWQLSLTSKKTPSILSLTRQSVPTVRSAHSKENLCGKGAYILAEAEGEHAVTIFSSGSEVAIALEAQRTLHSQSIGTRVISVPCFELFDQQESDYRVSLLCNDSIKVAIEAASGFGWERYIGPHGIFIGMNSFGASAPANELYKHFGISANAIVERVQTRLAEQKKSK